MEAVKQDLKPGGFQARLPSIFSYNPRQRKIKTTQDNS
jgi:hypothetical protein